MFGFINLNKPQGFTSHDCIAKTRRLLKTKKVGHGGTLDPEATGVLPIAVGQATRLLQFLPEKKAYRARIRLGIQTTTDDLEGDVIQVQSVANIQREDILLHLQKFNGQIEQIPPIYSAIKQKGNKLYELARKGIEVEVPPRNIMIYGCELIAIDVGEFTEIDVEINCGAGTYIRAIARDLGKMLGVGGTLANLIRTKSCGMELQNSISFTDIKQQLENNTFKLIDADIILSHIPAITLNIEESKRWCHGQTISLAQNKSLRQDKINPEKNNYLRIYQDNQQFLGISILRNQSETYAFSAKPKIVCFSYD